MLLRKQFDNSSSDGSTGPSLQTGCYPHWRVSRSQLWRLCLSVCLRVANITGSSLKPTEASENRHWKRLERATDQVPPETSGTTSCSLIASGAAGAWLVGHSSLHSPMNFARRGAPWCRWTDSQVSDIHKINKPRKSRGKKTFLLVSPHFISYLSRLLCSWRTFWFRKSALQVSIVSTQAFSSWQHTETSSALRTTHAFSMSFSRVSGVGLFLWPQSRTRASQIGRQSALPGESYQVLHTSHSRLHLDTGYIFCKPHYYVCVCFTSYGISMRSCPPYATSKLNKSL